MHYQIQLPKIDIERMRTIAIGVVAISIAVYCLQGGDTASAFTAKTWDGGGVTNNWSEAANWSGDTVPAAGDDVTFDATSTKNVMIDTNIHVGSIAIAGTYTGTITQSNTASIQINGCSGRPCFLQSGGTFNGGTNTMTLNSAGFGGFRMLGGTFNGGSGDINIPNGPAFGADFLLQGGSFKSTSGTLTVAGHFAFQNPGTVFLHNNGTVTLAAVQTQFLTADGDHTSINFNNLNISSANGVNYDLGLRAIVEGTLSLNDGTIGQGNNGTVIEARGGFSVSPDFDGGIGRVEFGPGGSPRTITLVPGLVYPSIRLNDPNLVVNTSGSGMLVMPHQLNIAQGTFNQGAVDMTINSLGVSGGPCLVMSGGAFNGSNKTITLISDGFGTIFMTNGMFNGGSGDIIATGDAPPDTNHDIQVNGGIFKSTSGTLFVPRAFRFQNGGVFQNNGGTVVFNSGTTTSIVSDDGMGNSPPIVFNNLTYSRDNGAALLLLANTIIVNGTLSLTDGIIDDGGGFRTIEARGNVNVASTFDGLTFRITLLFSGAACQTVTLSGTQNFPGSWTANKTGCGITATGNFGVGSVSIPSGAFIVGLGSHVNVTNGVTVNANGSLTVSGNTVVNVSGPVTISGTAELNDVAGPAVINLSDITTISGTLDLSSASNMINLNSLHVDAGGQFVADNPEIITLAGDVVNNGLINLHGFGSECLPFGGTYVTLQSSITGTRRNWSGNGVFRMVHVNAFDMGGTAPIAAHNSVNSGGNNGPNWTFDSVCQPNVLHTPFDFDGDSKSDVGIFRPSTGEWWINRSTLGLAVPVFGSTTDKITPADFDGDGLTDIAVWRELAQSRFFILESSTNTVRSDDFGVIGDDPRVVGDWDGDGRADPAVYRHGAPNTQSIFFFRGSNNNPSGNITFLPWGNGSDQPVNGDFDGDGKHDPAVFRPADGNWWIQLSSNGANVVQHWGLADDKTVTGDFDGDGKSDMAVFRPSDTTWYILQSLDGQPRIQQFGLATDILTTGDYDGDSKSDISVYRPSNGQNWTLLSGNGTSRVLTFGTVGDLPVASVIQ